MQNDAKLEAIIAEMERLAAQGLIAVTTCSSPATSSWPNPRQFDILQSGLAGGMKCNSIN
jgi:hypothetical protein